MHGRASLSTGETDEDVVLGKTTSDDQHVDPVQHVSISDFPQQLSFQRESADVMGIEVFPVVCVMHT